MATATNKHGAKKLQQAIRSVVETLEQRQMLTAGQLDYSFYDHDRADDTFSNTFGYLRETTPDGTLVYQAFDRNQVDTGAGESYTTLPDIDLTAGTDNRIVKVLVDNSGKIIVIGHNVARTGFSGQYTLNDAPSDSDIRWYEGVILHDDIYVARFLPNGEREAYSGLNDDQAASSGDWGGNGHYDFGDLGGHDTAGQGLQAYTDALDAATPDLGFMYGDEAVSAAIDPRNGDIVVLGRKVQASGAFAYSIARYEASNLDRGTVMPIDLGGVGDINDMRIMDDGSIVVVGMSTTEGSAAGQVWFTPGTGYYAVAARFNGDTGALISNFQIPAFSSYSDDRFWGVDVDNRGTVGVEDDRVYIVGTTDDRTWDALTGKQRLVLLRYDANGVLDSSFSYGPAGAAELEDFGGKNVIGRDVKVQPDGRIVVLGNIDQVVDLAGNAETAVVARFTEDGILDTSFIGGGRAYILPSGTTAWYGNELALQSDGSIIVSGKAQSGGLTTQVIRLDKTGRNDLTFGVQSFGEIPTAGGVNGLQDVALFNDASISLTINRGPSGAGDDKVLVGWNTSATSAYAVARLLTNNTAPTANLQAPDVYNATTTYTFTVTYTDDEFVSVASTGVSALGYSDDFAGFTIYKPDGTELSVANYRVTNVVRMTTPQPDHDGDGIDDAKTVSVTYEADLGTGFPLDSNGLYQIAINGGVIKDTNRKIDGTDDSFAMSGRTLGAFTVNIDNSVDANAPTAVFYYDRIITGTATSVAAIGVAQSQLVDLKARWNQTKLVGADVTVMYAGKSITAKVTSMDRSNPANAWFDTLVLNQDVSTIVTGSEPITYSISVRSNDLVDGLTVRGRSYFDIHVVYSDAQSLIDVSQIGNADIQVVGPRGYNQAARYIPGSLKLLNAYRQVEATYRIFAPGTVDANGDLIPDNANTPWDSTDNGLYRVLMNANQLSDTATVKNYIAAGQIGQFNVAVNDMNTVYPTVKSIDITPDQDLAAGTQIKGSRASIGIVVTFAKSDYSTGLLDPASNFAGAIRVTNAGGFNQLAIYVDQTANADGTYTVRYTLTPGDNSWDFADNASYIVSLEANTIRDTENPANYAQPATLTTFDVAIASQTANARPTAAVAPLTIDAMRTLIPFKVTFSATQYGKAPIDLTSNFAGAITVTGPNGYSQPALYHAGTQVVNPDGSVEAYYTIQATDNIWSYNENGAYTVRLNAGAIKDSDTPANVSAQMTAGTITVNIDRDNPKDARPHATVQSGLTAINQVTGARQIKVMFNAGDDGVPIDPSAIGSGIKATYSLIINGVTTTQTANVVMVGMPELQANGYDYLATYDIAPSASDPTWSASNTGPVTIDLVRDGNGVALVKDTQFPPEPVADFQGAHAFTVNIDLPKAVLLSSSQTASQHVISFDVEYKPAPTDPAYPVPVIIDAGSNFDAVTVSGPTAANVTFFKYRLGASGSIIATYHMTRAGGDVWQAADYGSYVVRVAGNQVRDTEILVANSVPDSVAGSIQVNVDNAIRGYPAVSLVSVTPATIRTTHGPVTIKVRFDPSQVPGAAIVPPKPGDPRASTFLIKVTSPTGQVTYLSPTTPAVLVGNSYEATYSYAPAGGTFGATYGGQNETYQIGVDEKVVWDSWSEPYEYNRAGVLGAFDVNIAQGRLDYTFYDPNFNFGPAGTYGFVRETSNDALFGFDPISRNGLPAGTRIDAGPDFDLTGGIDNRIVKTMVDNAGKVYVIGYSVGRLTYQAAWTETNIPDPAGGAGTVTQPRLIEGNILHRDLYVAVYSPNGELESVVRTNGTNVPSSLDQYQFNGGRRHDFGTLNAPFQGAFNQSGLPMALQVLNQTEANANQNGQLEYNYNDDAITAAIDPTDGTIVVIFRKQLPATPGVARQNQWYMARYSPVANLAQRALSMTQLAYSGTVTDMRMLSDGSFVLVGNTSPTTNPITGLDAVAARYDRNGGLIANLQIPPFTSYSYDFLNGVDLDDRGTATTADDLLYVVGMSDDSTWDNNNGKERFVLQRYTAAGAIDTTFGFRVNAELADFGGKNVQGWDVKVQPNGKVVVLAHLDALTDSGGTVDTTVVARFNTDGTLDTTFLGGRVYILPAGRTSWLGRELAIQSDGGIVVSGLTDAGVVEVIRLNQDGSADTTFGVQSMGQLPGAPTNTVDPFWELYGSTLTVNRGPNGNGDDKVLFAWNSGDASQGEDYFAVARMLHTNQEPTADTQAKDVTGPVTSYDFIVTYTDDEFMSVATLGTVGAPAAGFALLLPDGTPFGAATVRVKSITGMTRPAYDRDGDGTTDYKSVSVVYTVDLPTGFPQNGYYTIRYANGQISDANRTAANEAAVMYLSDRMLGGFWVRGVGADPNAPTVTFAYDKDGDGTRESNDIAAGLKVRGRAYFDFNVVYDDYQSMVNSSLLGTGDLQVVGPRGYVYTATMVGTPKLLNNEYSVQVTYRILAPNATGDADYAHPWNSTWNGLYRIYMQPQQVADRADVPNYVSAREVGQFQVAINDSEVIYPQAKVLSILPDNDTVAGGVQVTASREAVQITVQFLPSKYSNGVIDPASNFANAIRVTTATGFSRLATLVGTATDNGDGTFTAVYTIAPADGSWDIADNALYRVALEAGAIRDTEVPANYSQQTNLDLFTVAIVAGQDARPTVTMAPVLPIAAKREKIALTVTFAPSQYGKAPISPASQFAGAIQVTSPSGFSALATLETASPTPLPDGSYVLVYSISPADRVWDAADFGQYQVWLVGSIADSDIPANHAVLKELGRFDVNTEDNDARPYASLTVTDIKAVQGAHTFTVEYKVSSSAVGTGIVISPTSDFATAITVTDNANKSYAVEMVGVQAAGTGYLATYRVNTADLTWSVTDFGKYTVSLVARKIVDTQILPEWNEAQSLGLFEVDIAGPKAELVNRLPETLSRHWVNFTVNYLPPQDTAGAPVEINGGSDFSTAISVVGPNSTPILVQRYEAPTRNADGSYTVRYQMTPADNLWEVADNGDYAINVVGNKVFDTDTGPNDIKAGNIGTIKVAIGSNDDRAYPNARMIAIPKIEAQQGPVTITVTFSSSSVPNGEIDTDSPFAIVVVDPAGRPVTLFSPDRPMEPNASGIYTLTYTYSPPNPRDYSFDPSDIGTYTVLIPDGSVADNQSPPEYTPAGPLGSFEVDVVLPNAVFTPIDALPITQPTGSLNFKVTYSSSDGIDFATVTTAPARDNIVLVTGPAGFAPRFATYVSSTPLNSKTIEVTYRVIAPKNMPAQTDSPAWDRRDNGTYTVQIVANNGVRSVKGMNLAPVVLRTFDVNVPSALHVGELDVTYDIDGYMRTTNILAQARSPISPMTGVTQESGGKLIYSSTALGRTTGLTDYYMLRVLQNGGYDVSAIWGNIRPVPSMQRYASSDDESSLVLMQSTGRFVVIGRTTLYLNNGTVVANALSMSRFYPTGVLDGSFDDNDTNHDVPEWTPGTTAYEAAGLTGLFVHDAFIQSDDKIVVVATSRWADTGADWIIARVNANGTIDTTFGNGGSIHVSKMAGTTPNSAFESYASDEPLAVAVQPDNKIVIGGYSDTRTFNQYTGYRKFVMMRLNENGTYDTSFDADGVVEVADFGRTDASVEALAIQRDGKILAVGYANGKGVIVRLNTNGSIDGTFGNRGIVQIDSSYVPLPGAIPTDTYNERWGYDVNLQDDGKILITTRDPSQAKTQLFRYFANGTPDTSFGTGGFATTDPLHPDGATMLAYRSMIQSDGKIVVTGAEFSRGAYELATARFLGDNYPPQAVLQATNMEFVPLDPVTLKPDDTEPYRFSVEYTDNFLLDITTLDINDVEVQLPNSATRVKVNAISFAAIANTNRVLVTYTLNAIGGTWDYLDNGNYQVWQVANQVYDIDGQVALAAPARNLGVFIVRLSPPGIIVPTAEMVAHNGQMVVGADYLDIEVIYRDDQAVKLSSIDANDIRVTGPNFYLADNAITPNQISVLGIVRQDGATAVANEAYLKVTYRITPPGGTWDFNENGTYYVFMKPSEVSDGDPVPNFVAGSLTMPLGNIEVDVISDTVAPTAQINLPPVTEAGLTTYLFTVTYRDNGRINVSTLGDGDLRITGPNGYDVGAHFVSSTPAINAGTVVATYSITPPGGTWDAADAGDYVFTMNSYQVSDNAAIPNYVAAGVLGTLTIGGLTDTLAPVATLASIATLTVDADTISLLVTYNDNAALDLTSFDLGDIQIRRLSDNLVLTPIARTVSGAGSTVRTVTYDFAGPGGTWDFADNGGYEVWLQPNQVADTQGNMAAAGKLGGFSVAIPDDTQKPVVGTVAASTVTVAGPAFYDFQITWTDNQMLRASTLGDGNVVVEAPDGTPLVATFRSATPSGVNAPSITATYRITPPGGSWNGWDNGTYKITVIADQVRDMKGNAVDAGVAGTFTVDIAVAPINASLVSVQTPAGGDSNMYVTVSFSSIDSIDSATLQAPGIITMTKGAVVLTGTFSSFVSGGGNQTTQVVKFAIRGPGGAWDYRDNGIYSIAVKTGNPVRTTEGGSLAPVGLGSATISIQAVQLVGTELLITGTDDNDMIELRMSGADIQTVVNGSVTLTAAVMVNKITIYALAGEDTVEIRSGIMGVRAQGGDGNDKVTGGDGNDTLMGNFGNDVLYGGKGNDSLQGGLGDDMITGAQGNDTIAGGDGKDTIDGGLDTAYGVGAYVGPDDDFIEGKGKADLIYGRAGNDTISGGAGIDTIYAGDGDDRIESADNYTLNGIPGAFADVVYGEAGWDTCVSDFADILTGVEDNLLS